MFITIVFLGLIFTSTYAQQSTCYSWDGSITFQEAVNTNNCISIVPNTYSMTRVELWQPTTIIGNGATLIATGSSWQTDPAAANYAMFMVHTGANLTISGITLDGNNIASYLVTPGDYNIDHTTLKNGACSALGIMKTGARITNSTLQHNGWACAQFSGLVIGAAIYGQHNLKNEYYFSPYIANNTIFDSNGPALDSNGVWGGTFTNNFVYGNSGWAAVSIYGGSYWTITNNTVSQPPTNQIQDYHPYCNPTNGPNGSKSAAIFLCQDSGSMPWLTDFITISGNWASGAYGILLVGADEIQPWMTPRLITIKNNNLIGSQIGCADDLKKNQWLDGNTWTGNNCRGTANSAPVLF